MSYKTILVHVDRSRNASERYGLAARLANTERAHLVGFAPTGISRYVHPLPSGQKDGTGVMPSEDQFDTLRKEAHQMLTGFEEQVRGAGVRSFESRIVDDEAGAGLSLQGRYADLIVIGQAERDNSEAATMTDFPEFVVLNSGRPVLLVPSIGQHSQAGGRLLVAWDAGTSATRAVTAALPLLRRASNVDVAVLNAESSIDGHGADPGADIALYLARHDVKVNVVQRKTETGIGETLLSLASDLGTDLLVMGCYGHSRFRETLLGGATRTVLEKMHVPVLMAH